MPHHVGSTLTSCCDVEPLQIVQHHRVALAIHCSISCSTDNGNKDVCRLGTGILDGYVVHIMY